MGRTPRSSPPLSTPGGRRVNVPVGKGLKDEYIPSTYLVQHEDEEEPEDRYNSHSVNGKGVLNFNR